MRRVKDEEQKKAWGAMHRGDFRAALETFDRQGALQLGRHTGGGEGGACRKVDKDSAEAPEKNRFVFAATNAEVSELTPRFARRARSAASLATTSLPTREGEHDFATGDRVQFTASAANRSRDAGLYTDAIGTITAIEENRVTVALDAPKGARAARRIFHRRPGHRGGRV